MNINFSFSSNSNSDNQKKVNRKLSAQEEYWLDRILRNHSGQMFTIIFLFLILIIGTVILAVVNKDEIGSSSEFSVIQVNPK